MSIHPLPLHPSLPRPTHRLQPDVRLTGTDRLHLLLAAGSALTATTWGLCMALVVLLVVAARMAARRRIGSVAAGRGVLAPAHDAHLLHPAGQGGQAVARP